MAEYKERTVAATAHQRVRTVTFVVEKGETPRVIFQEEEILLDGNGDVIIKRDVSYCEGELDAANGVIPLRSPATGELTGASITHAQLYSAIYSLYRQVAAARDGA